MFNTTEIVASIAESGMVDMKEFKEGQENTEIDNEGGKKRRRAFDDKKKIILN